MYIYIKKKNLLIFFSDKFCEKKNKKWLILANFSFVNVVFLVTKFELLLSSKSSKPKNKRLTKYKVLHLKRKRVEASQESPQLFFLPIPFTKITHPFSYVHLWPMNKIKSPLIKRCVSDQSNLFKKWTFGS